MTSERRGTLYLRPGVGFETGVFVQEKLGGLPQNDPVALLEDDGIGKAGTALHVQKS